MNAITADVVAPAERSRAFGLLSWATNLRMAVAAAHPRAPEIVTGER